MTMLMVRKLADKSSSERVKMIDKATGAPKLVDPNTPGEDHEPWPLAGIQLNDGKPPAETACGQGWADTAVQEGWLTREGERLTRQPGALPTNSSGGFHVFVEADKLVFHTVDGDVVYEVVENPGKYSDDSEAGYRVEFRYLLRLVEVVKNDG